jgi:hypothetical protein
MHVGMLAEATHRAGPATASGSPMAPAWRWPAPSGWPGPGSPGPVAALAAGHRAGSL